MYSEGDDVNGEFIQPNNIVKYCHLHNITEATQICLQHEITDISSDLTQKKVQGILPNNKQAPLLATASPNCYHTTKVCTVALGTVIYGGFGDADNQPLQSFSFEDVLVITCSFYRGHFLQQSLWQQNQIFLKSCWDNTQHCLWGQNKEIQNTFPLYPISFLCLNLVRL